jgi:hypothetical protein
MMYKFEIIGYNSVNSTFGMTIYHDRVDLTITAESEKKATITAKKVATRKYYNVRYIREVN